VRRSFRPCIVSHTGCRAVYDTARNKSDAAVRLIADKGGVVGVFNMTMWLADEDDGMAAILSHIEHVVRIAGVDHAAFGSDHEAGGVRRDPSAYLASMQKYARTHLGQPGSERIPGHVMNWELSGPDRLHRLAEALARRGYAPRDIEKIIGGNVARVFGEACG
jgi:membrane dipeptidase